MTDGGPVINVNDDPVGNVVITGTVARGSELTADTSGISDADGLGAFSYQWLRNGTNIAGATSSTYTPGDPDVGTTISVAVSYTDGNGTTEDTDQCPGRSGHQRQRRPRRQRRHHRHRRTRIRTDRRHQRHQRRRRPRRLQLPVAARRHAIAGATSSTYTLGDARRRHHIFASRSATPMATRPRRTLTSARRASGHQRQRRPRRQRRHHRHRRRGSELTADTSGISDADGLGAFSYQWLRDGVDIAGATSSTYTLGDADVGTTDQRRVSYTDGNGTS